MKFKPLIYKRLSTVQKKVQNQSSISYEIFESQNKAKQFIKQLYINKKKFQQQQQLARKINFNDGQKLLHELYDMKDFSKQVMYGFKLKKIQDFSYQKLFAFFDGCSKGNPGKSGAGYLFLDHQGKIIFKQSLFLGICTSNQAQIKALLMCLVTAYCNGVSNLSVYGDSQIVIKGMTGQYNISSPNIIKQFNSALILKQKFKKIFFTHVPRRSNIIADKLANLDVY